MPEIAALPFTIKRRKDVVGLQVISTRETVHGLLRMQADHLYIQWRTFRTIDKVGMTIEQDREIEDVRELVLPLSALANAEVRWSWVRWPPGHYLILTGADLMAFEQLASKGGLQLEHPAEFAIRLKRPWLMAAREFASEVRLAFADRALRAAEAAQLGTGGSL